MRQLRPPPRPVGPGHRYASRVGLRRRSYRHQELLRRPPQRIFRPDLVATCSILAEDRNCRARWDKVLSIWYQSHTIPVLEHAEVKVRAGAHDKGSRKILATGSWTRVSDILKVALDIDYHHNMYTSHQKVNPKEVIVGWYSTGFGVTGGSALIHEFYSREATNAGQITAVHLTVDTSFTNGEASVKAFVSSNLSLADRPLAAQFYEIPLDMRMLEAEKIGFDILKMTKVDKLPTDLEGMEASMERVRSLIEDVYKYVDDVVEGRVAPDNNIGRFILNTLASVPKMSPAAFDKVLNDKIQDNYALVYLASLTRTQLSIAEKLNTAAQIL